MQEPMYDMSVPLIIKMLNNLSNILSKAEKFSTRRKIEDQVLLESRLIADMFPLSKQIQNDVFQLFRTTSILKNEMLRLFQD